MKETILGEKKEQYSYKFVLELIVVNVDKCPPKCINFQTSEEKTNNENKLIRNTDRQQLLE